MPTRTSICTVLAALTLISTACGEDEAEVPQTPATTSTDLTADLQIRYEHPEAGVSFEYGIECGPDSSELTRDGERAEVDVSEACERLEVPEVSDRLLDGADDDICTEVYGGPDTSEVTSTIFSEPVDTIVDRTNGCGIADWDELLDEILPPAIGITPSTTTG